VQHAGLSTAPADALGKEKNKKRDSRRNKAENDPSQMLYKYTGVTCGAVKQALARGGFVLTEGDSWNLLWGKPLKLVDYKELAVFQKCNHFPGTWELGRKVRYVGSGSGGLPSTNKRKGALCPAARMQTCQEYSAI
jgi:hypothetical protein